MNPLWDTLFGRHEGSTAPFLHLPDGRVVTYAGFLGLAARYAHLLTEQGLKPRDRLALQVAKSPEALALYAACVQTGIVFLPLNTAYTPAEMEYFISDSGAALVVGDPAADRLAEIARRYGARYLTLGEDGRGTLTDLSAGPGTYPTVPRAGIDLAAFLYTSGTTGRSKGAMLTQDNLLSNARVLAEAWEFTAGDVLLHALPIFHTHGLFVATNVTLAAGGSMIFLPRFELDAVIARLPLATAMMGVPTFYTRLLGDPRFDADLCRGIRLLISGSAPMLEETHRQVEARTGHRVLERYGMTETGMICSNPCDGERRIGTVGPPLPGVTVRVMAEGREVPRGEIGVLHVKGPNVYPKEIEQLLDEMPGVLESAVIGAPHPDFGETPVALLVPDGQGPDLAAVEAALKERLAGYKRPRLIEVVPELPRNTMGKVQKAELRKRYETRFS